MLAFKLISLGEFNAFQTNHTLASLSRTFLESYEKLLYALLITQISKND
jgi:hypothetical protein